MGKLRCNHCGSNVLVRGCISLRCPLCGEYVFMEEANKEEMWSEHKVGLLMKSGGWSFMDIIEPPSWFLEHVV